MGFKKILKKWGTYALGVIALTGGFVASNMINNESTQVSAAEITNESRFILTKSEYTHAGNVTSRIQVTDITGRANIETVEQVNGVYFNHLSISYTGNTFSYTGYGDSFYVDISDLDNFNLETHLLKHVKDSSTTERTGQTGYNGNLYLIDRNGNIVEFMERTDFQDVVQNIYDQCVRSVVTLETEGTDMSVRYFSISSANLGIGTINDEEGTTTFMNVAPSGISYSLDPTNVNIDLYIRSAEDLLFATMDGSGLYTENDVNNAYDTGYKEGHIDGYSKGSIPGVDANGKYGYIIETEDVNKVVYINESNRNIDTLYTNIFFDGLHSAEYNWYQYSSYFINVDEFVSVENLTYDDIVRSGNDDLVSSSENYFWYVNFNYRSESKNNENLIKFMNSVDFVELSNKILNLIYEHEILVLNEGNEELQNSEMYYSHTDLGFLGETKVEEGTGNLYVDSNENEGSLSMAFHPHNETGLMSVVKRSYDDLMYGDYVEDGDAIQGIGMYEQGFSDGYEAGKNHNNNSTGGYTEEDLNAKYEEGFVAGSESVDITIDNEQVINDFIVNNNMKTEEEYLIYGEEKYTEGKEKNANEYAERLNELDTTINNLNNEINELNSKINDYESTDDKYQVGYETGYNAGHSAGYQQGYNEALSEDIETYGEEQYQKGYNSGYSVGYNKGYSTAQAEKDEVIEDVEEEKNNLVEQVESLQNDITNLNNRINTLTGTINSMNELIDTKYQEGYDDGVDSVDITVDNDEAYQKGYDDGYTQCEIDNPPSITYPENTYEFGFKDGYDNGYKEGKESVDITIDNQQAIEDYIENENMKTEEEYLSYGKEKYDSGYKNNSFGNQVKRLGSNIGTFFVNLGKGIVQYVAFGWAWDKSGKFIPNF